LLDLHRRAPVHGDLSGIQALAAQRVRGHPDYANCTQSQREGNQPDGTGAAAEMALGLAFVRSQLAQVGTRFRSIGIDKSQLATAGKALAGLVGAGGLVAYFVADASDSGRLAIWPYGIFGAALVVGLVLAVACQDRTKPTLSADLVGLSSGSYTRASTDDSAGTYDLGYVPDLSTSTQLPPPVAGFAGREAELAELTSWLDPEGEMQDTTAVAVTGPIGVGKTSLAVKAASAARGWYPGGIYFIDLHGYDKRPVGPRQALDALLRALGVPSERIPPATDKRAKLYQAKLDPNADRMLVVADNARDEEQVRLLVPGPGPHRLVVTSGHSLGTLQARLLDLKVLDTEAGAAMLDAALRVARPDDRRISADPKSARQLVRLCDGLPLALQNVASQLKDQPMLTPAELAADLASAPDLLDALKPDHGHDTSLPAVKDVFERCYRLLGEVPALVFRMLPLNPGPGASAVAAAALAGLSTVEAAAALDELAREHLIETMAGPPRQWRLHNLLRRYALQLSDARQDADEREQARDRLLNYYLRYARAADAQIRAAPGQLMPGDFTNRDEAVTWLDAQWQNLVAAVLMAADTGRDRMAFELVEAVAQYLSERRHYDEKLEIAAVGLEAARRLGDRRREGQVLTILGGTWPHVGRFDEAATACRQAAEIFQTTGDRNFEAQARANLGNALAQGNHPEAVTELRKAVAIFQDLGDDRAKAVALVDLGNALAAAGQAGEATAVYNEARGIFQVTGERDREAWALECLSNLLVWEGQFQEARSASRLAARAYQETHNLYGQGTALDLLGVAEWQVHRIALAAAIWEQAAACFAETGDRQKEAAVLIQLGRLLPWLLRAPGAVPILKRAASIYRETGDRDGEDLALASLRLVRKSARWQRWLPQPVVRLLGGPPVSWNSDGSSTWDGQVPA
jgi:tetratricopeptide (TPR) repeat protein